MPGRDIPSGSEPNDGRAPYPEDSAEGTAPDTTNAGEPARPRVERMRRLGALSSWEANDVAIYGGNAYVATPTAIHVVDVREPSFPHAIGELPIQASGVDAGDRFVFAASTRGLEIIDVYIPELPELVERVTAPADAFDVTVVNDRAYLAAGDAGLIIVDISTPSFLRLAGGVDTAGRATAVAVGEGFAAVADGPAGLQMVELPFFASIFGNLPAGGATVDVALSGTTAFVADRNAGLLVVDVGEPDRPYVLGGVTVPGQAMGVAVRGDRAYVVDGTSLLEIDVSDPAQPEIVDQIILPGEPRRLVLSGGNAFIAAGPGGLQIVSLP